MKVFLLLWIRLFLKVKYGLDFNAYPWSFSPTRPGYERYTDREKRAGGAKIKRCPGTTTHYSAQDHNILILFVTSKVARSEGAQDIFENIPAWQPVDQGGWRKPLFEMCCIHTGIAQLVLDPPTPSSRPLLNRHRGALFRTLFFIFIFTLAKWAKRWFSIVSLASICYICDMKKVFASLSKFVSESAR